VFRELARCQKRRRGDFIRARHTKDQVTKRVEENIEFWKKPVYFLKKRQKKMGIQVKKTEKQRRGRNRSKCPYCMRFVPTQKTILWYTTRKETTTPLYRHTTLDPHPHQPLRTAAAAVAVVPLLLEEVVDAFEEVVKARVLFVKSALVNVAIISLEYDEVNVVVVVLEKLYVDVPLGIEELEEETLELLSTVEEEVLDVEVEVGRALVLLLLLLSVVGVVMVERVSEVVGFE